jgi:phenylacetate-CoA ligase
VNPTAVLIEKLWNQQFHRLYGLPYPPIRQFLQTSQYWLPAEREAYQVLHLNSLIASAVAGSPFYHKRFAGHESHIDSLAALHQLPKITKRDILANISTITMASATDRSFAHTTSGSTGDPLKVTISAKAAAFRCAGHQRLYEWWGLRSYDRSALLWGRKLTVPPPQRDDVLKRLRAAVRYATIDRQFFIDVFDLNRDSVSGIYRKLVAYKPRYLRGYKSGVLQLAELLRELNLSGDRLALKLVVVTSEVLLPDERQFMEAVFQCPVANEYGAAEAGLFAVECPQQKLHVYEEAVALLAGESGEVLVSELFNRQTPLINYLNGDAIEVSNEQCRCGRTLRVVDAVKGRFVDTVRTVSGDSLSPYIIYYAVKELDDIDLGQSIQKYKVIQRGNSFEFIVVPDRNYGIGVVEYLTGRLKSKVGQEIEVRFTIVDEIPREKSGKLRFFVRE